MRGLLMGALLHVNPGPIARLREVTSDPNALSVIVQRITDADTPETLKDIARSLGVPLGKLSEWITEDRERTEQYANALRIASEQAALDSLRIADGIPQQAVDPDGKPLFDSAGNPVLITPDVQRDKLRVDTRMKLASKLAREKFGEMNEVRVSGSVSLISVLSSLPRGNVIDITPEAGAPKKIPEKTADFTI